jgi:hypothetical protein
MDLTPPSAAQEPLERTLEWAFGRAGADWTARRPDLPPRLNLCPSGGAKRTEVGDRWLPMEFPALVLDLARRVGLDGAGHRALADALRAVKLETLPVTRTVRILTDAKVSARPVARTEACPVMTAYLEPLLDPRAYGSWLHVMAYQDSAIALSESKFAVPHRVRQRELDRDREIAERWAGEPPLLAEGDSDAAKLEKRRRRALAFLSTDPNALPITVPPDVSVKEAQALAALQRAQRSGGPGPESMPVVMLGSSLAPANLYISEVAPTLAAYLWPLHVVLNSADRLGMVHGLMAVAYGLLALVSVPVNCLYDAYHGTCTMEVLVPRLLACTATWAGFAGGGLKQLAGDRLWNSRRSEEHREAAQLLEAFRAWSEALSAAFREALYRLLRTAAEQGGGRVRTPAQMTPSGEWRLTLTEQGEDGTPRAVERRAAEAISQDRPAGHEEIFWMLPTLWAPFGTAVALANQSGVRVWINAANNRWGGRHPPHSDHRQGATFDLDAALAWKLDKKGNPIKVRNVLQRDAEGFPVTRSPDPTNKDVVDCLTSWSGSPAGSSPRPSCWWG